MNRRSAIWLAGALALSACATAPVDLSAVEAEASRFQGDVPGVWPSDLSGAPAPVDWIGAFNDPQLTDLVAQALAYNSDLSQAEARRDRALAQLRAARAARFPTLTVAGRGREASAFDNSEGTAGYSAALTASYEVDVWGRLAQAQADRASAFEAAGADLEAARRLLASSVFQAYIAAIEARAQTRVLREILERSAETLGFIEVQFDRGLRSGRDLALIRADVETTRSSVIAAQNAERDALRALEILIGRYPNLSTELGVSQPALPEMTGLGVPGEILQSRPDLVAAKARLEAALARGKGARAARRPRINVAAALDRSAMSLADLADPGAWAAARLADFSAPVFDAGRLEAGVDLADADTREAAAAYESAVRSAFLEVETALDETAALQLQEAAIRRALNEAEQAFRFTQFNYDNGAGDLLDVLSLQQRVASLQSAAARIERQRLQQFAVLALAVGADPRPR
ncbi:MAG: efflux transporter outer membrane subunit [Pseudomonadota bacterium]